MRRLTAAHSAAPAAASPSLAATGAHRRPRLLAGVFAPALFGLALGTLVLAVPAGPASAQQGEGDRVVATVNGSDIRLSDVVRSAQSLPPQYQQQLPQIFPALVERLIDMRLMEEAGRAEGLADGEQVRAAVAQAEREAISQAYLQQALEDAFTEEAIDEAYARWAAENPPQEEVRASHILVEEEEAARALIAELDEGADFSALAEEHSIDPSAEGRGGDLGYFTRERMVAPFSAAAFEIEPGSYGSEPVETRFGWHVIRVEDRRSSEPPSREELRGQLEEIIATQAIEEIRTRLRAEAEIELHQMEAPAVMPEAEPEGEAPAAQ